jgi:hypothetical protein
MQERDWEVINARLLSCVTLLITLVYSTSLAQTSPPVTKPLPSPILTPKPIAKSTPIPKPSLNKIPRLSEDELAEGKVLLNNLRYWLQVDTPGLDASFRHALTAFQKVEGRARTGILTAEELQALRQAERPKAVDPTHSYIEIDLNRQVLFVVDATGEVQKILPVSTGSGELFTEGGRTRRAITPTGKFKVQRKIAGWRKSTLGLLYYPSYIYDGVAIHGNPTVPPKPASHGCIRIPMFAAKEFFDLAVVGIEVLIYGDKPATLTAPGPCKPPEIRPQQTR